MNSIKIVKFTQYKSPENIHCTGFHKGGGGGAFREGGSSTAVQFILLLLRRGHFP